MTIVPLRRRDLALVAVLAAAMWLTRSHEISRFLTLPDASWAAFFVAGLLATRWPGAGLLMAVAGATDYLALRDGVSDYCVTPAYVFLVPTYLALWAMGRCAGAGLSYTLRGLLRVSALLSAAVIGAFFISNASFYGLSGYFENLPALAYAQAVAPYFPMFLEGTALYTAVALLAVYVWRARAGLDGTCPTSDRT